MSKSNGNGPHNPLGKFFPEALRQRLAEDLQLTGKAKRTQNGYLRAVRQLSDFAQCSPDKVTETQVRQFFLHLKNDRAFAYGSLRVALSGVKFFFSVTCKRNWEIFKMLKLQNINALPEVLTIGQVHRLVAATTTQRMFGSSRSIPSKHMRATASVVSNGKPVNGTRNISYRRRTGRGVHAPRRGNVPSSCHVPDV